MVLAAKDRVHFYNSKNLKEWTFGGEFGATEGAHTGVWECPDLFPMKVIGQNKTKWVLIGNIGDGAPNGGSGTQYFVGDFDGKTFKNDNSADKTVSRIKKLNNEERVMEIAQMIGGEKPSEAAMQNAKEMVG